MMLHPFVNAVRALRFESCFNPYSDRCEVHDRKRAPLSRALALSQIVSRAADAPIDALWLGRDLGYRGGRRTGLALTDDVHIALHMERWNCTFKRPTTGTAMAERTAAIIWSVLEKIDAKVFLWNVFPLHPHEEGDPFSNRQHNAHERKAGEETLETIVRLLRPRRILAIGNDASAAAKRVVSYLPIHSVRHPSYGGQNMFLRQVKELYRSTPSIEC